MYSYNYIQIEEQEPAALPTEVKVHSTDHTHLSSGDKIILSPEVLVACEQQQLAYPVVSRAPLAQNSPMPVSTPVSFLLSLIQSLPPLPRRHSSSLMQALGRRSTVECFSSRLRPATVLTSLPGWWSTSRSATVSRSSSHFTPLTRLKRLAILSCVTLYLNCVTLYLVSLSILIVSLSILCHSILCHTLSCVTLYLVSLSILIVSLSILCHSILCHSLSCVTLYLVSLSILCHSLSCVTLYLVSLHQMQCILPPQVTQYPSLMCTCPKESLSDSSRSPPHGWWVGTLL